MLCRNLAIACLVIIGLISQANAADAGLIKRFAAIDSIWAAQISPDGKHLAVGCTQEGVKSVCVYELDSTNAKPRVFSAGTKFRLHDISWASPEWILISVNTTTDISSVSDSRSLMSVSRLIAINIRTNERTIPMAVSSDGLQGDLTDVAATPDSMPGDILMRAEYYLVPKDRDSRLAHKDAGWRLGVYRVNLKSGRTVRIQSSMPDTMELLVNAEGESVARIDFDKDAKRYTVLRVTRGSAEKVLEFKGTAKPVWDVYGIVDGGKKVAYGTYAEDGTYVAMLLDMSSGEIQPYTASPERLAVDGWIQEPNSDNVVGVYFTEDMPQQKFIDTALDAAHKALSKALGKYVYFHSWTKDRSLIALSAAASGEPSSYYLFDVRQKSLSPIGDARPELAGVKPALSTHIEYAARDGLIVHGYVTLPPGKTLKDGPFPLLILPHGGPLARDDASFDWWASYFAQRGYVVLKPNFRGSDGYGLAFREKGFGEFGGAMIDDVIDGARYLIAQGIADKARVCAMGASYGGYAALMVALRDDTLAKCVVAVNAVTDPTELLGQRIVDAGKDSLAADFWQEYMGSRFRDDVERAKNSPSRRADDFKVPVLLLHATDDTNVLVRHSRNLERKLKEAKADVRLVEFPGDDHYLNTTAVRTTLLTEIDTFLDKHIAGK